MERFGGITAAVIVCITAALGGWLIYDIEPIKPAEAQEKAKPDLWLLHSSGGREIWAYKAHDNARPCIITFNRSDGTAVSCP